MRNLDLVRVGREVKVKKGELANLKEEVAKKENAFRSRDHIFRLLNPITRSVTEAVLKLESSLQDKQKEATTPWASDSPLVPWLISSVLFNLAAGVHYLTTSTVLLDKITSALERTTTQQQSYPEYHEELGTLPSIMEDAAGMNLDLALQLVQEEAGVEMVQMQMTGEQAEDLGQMQLEGESRPTATWKEGFSSERFGQPEPSSGEQWGWGGAVSSSATKSEFDWSGRL